MSWAEVQNLKDHLSSLANSTLRIQCGENYAGKTIYLKRYDKEYMSVELDSQASADIEVAPKNQYEFVAYDATDPTIQYTSGKFDVGTGEFIEKEMLMTFDGGLVTPIDDVIIWQKCAGIYEMYGYTSTAQILADSGCITALLSSDNACKYMIRSTDTIMLALLTAQGIEYIRNCHTAQLALVKYDTGNVWAAAINRTPANGGFYNKIWEFVNPKCDGVTDIVANASANTAYNIAGTGVMITFDKAVTYARAIFNGTDTMEQPTTPYAPSTAATAVAYAGLNQSALLITIEFPYPVCIRNFSICPNALSGYSWTSTAYPVTDALYGIDQITGLEELLGASTIKKTVSFDTTLNDKIADNRKFYKKYKFNISGLMCNSSTSFYLSLSEIAFSGVKGENITYTESDSGAVMDNPNV